MHTSVPAIAFPVPTRFLSSIATLAPHNAGTASFVFDKVSLGVPQKVGIPIVVALAALPVLWIDTVEEALTVVPARPATPTVRMVAIGASACDVIWSSTSVGVQDEDLLRLALVAFPDVLNFTPIFMV